MGGRPRGHYSHNVREYRGKNGGLVLGDGCKLFPHCEDCPYEDCIAPTDQLTTSNAVGCIDNIGKHGKVGEATPVISFHSEDQFQGALDRLERIYGC
jgi:hypothetical protein